jgi:hypothetical protein
MRAARDRPAIASQAAARRPAAKKPAAPAKKKPAARKPAKKKPAAKKPTTAAKRPAAKKPATRKPRAPAKKKPALLSKKAIEKKLAAAGKSIERKVAAATKSLEKRVSAAGQSLKDTGQKIATAATATTASPATKTSAMPKKAAHKAAPVVRPPFKAYTGSKSYLFVSYSHRNTPEVFETLAKLKSRRFRIWYDEGIEPGAEWPEVIGGAVNGCSTMLVFMSRHASESRNVRNEINLAYAENKNIMVVFLEDTALTDGLQLQLGTVQSINKYELSESAFFEALATGLGTALKS